MYEESSLPERATSKMARAVALTAKTTRVMIPSHTRVAQVPRASKLSNRYRSLCLMANKTVL
jgi:hypothetical protein